MANELYISSDAAVQPYALVRRKSDLRVATLSAQTFVTFAGADLDAYDVPLTSGGGDMWAANFPAWVPAGEYVVQYFDRAGSAPATSDLKLRDAPLYWSGSTATAGVGAMPTAAEMVTLIRQALRDNPIGLVSVTTDGQTVQYGRQQALDELAVWERRAARESGKRPQFLRVNLG